MYICLVKHNGSETQYLFDCSNIAQYINLGSIVLCETMYGCKWGTTTTGPICIEGEFSGVNTLLKAYGAYLPLKKVVGIQEEISETAKEQIVINWINSKLYSCELPF